MNFLCRGTGYPILFIHGMPTSNQLWNGVIERMCGTYTCLAIDLPGWGKTPGEPYGADYFHRISNRLDKLRAQHQIERWHVVGHDAGAVIAAHYAHSFQPHVGKLALLSPPLFPDLKPYYLLECLRRPVLGEFLAPIATSIFWKVVMQRAVKNEEGTSGVAFHRFQEPFCGFNGPWQFMRVLRWGKPCEVLAHVPGMLPELLIPTLIVQGSRDRAIPQSFAMRARRSIPNSELVHVDCGHFIPLNRPGFVADRLHRFFGSGAQAVD